MVCLLPKNFAALFVPDEPIRFLPPIEKHWFPNYSGVSSYLTMFDQIEPNNEKKTEGADSFAPTWTKSGLRELRFLKMKEEKTRSLRTQIQTWDPTHNLKATDNPNRTIVVLRLPKKTDESILQQLFGEYGEIKKIVIIKDLKGINKGYAFVEYNHRSEAERACRRANGMRIEEKIIVVEMEKGRTEESFKPKRLGGTIERRRGEDKRRNESPIRRDRGYSPFERREVACRTDDRRGERRDHLLDRRDDDYRKAGYRTSRYERKVDRKDYRNDHFERRDDYKLSDHKDDYRLSDHRDDYRASDRRDDYRQSDHKDDYRSSDRRDDYRSSDRRDDYRQSDRRDDFKLNEYRDDYRASDRRDDYRTSDYRDDYRPSDRRDDYKLSDRRDDYKSSDRRDDYRPNERSDRFERRGNGNIGYREERKW
ncbi:U1 small nuclear ribonucleoprotein 70 kDa, putative [Entamoeba dispar SAW760]|uniref:U1 small nuclear ribonucleoprotein 70 kDa, putative n=1 Tax=Entamoeba dispar (strain ATCC PRA-260 / SAW760) TaxID=370354 RepID=B0EDH0_ENTDS|nr:U1 small nuclear ribonucleoprotein 70 kDa, putative [Entamoeba dispar SAW760]EDR27587.1 U1 small nuclear ribonucleoprotein 70 kDa, putative [Entamoeba dispar SAW760]|eukprot:EDR27587.1 U1 small nuclear ribonucleoprotein 70 kDa, putative [Entamoeba dispar SAW760]